jgi:2-polyprenyl-3-methyl-5-hydroxy-6-metoxy-1,4-benzoquinol methylase
MKTTEGIRLLERRNLAWKIIKNGIKFGWITKSTTKKLKMIYKKLAIDSLDRKIAVLDVGCGTGAF